MVASDHIFISYKSEQRPMAQLVCGRLREWGFEPWLDVERLQPGTYWANDIDQALKTCHACLAIMTPEAMSSRLVTNEWDTAIMYGKLFIPLLFEPTDPHYKYIDIQYVDFTRDDKSQSFAQLQTRLQAGNQPGSHVERDPYADYLQALYDRITLYLSQKLIPALRNERNEPEPIPLSLARMETANISDVRRSTSAQVSDPLFALGGIDVTEQAHEFGSFWDAFTYYQGRVLLLGEPGSGKTITMLYYLRDAVVRRRQDVSTPLPILGIVPTWNPSQTFEDWLASSYGAPTNAKHLIGQGRAVLFLDGLDELGNSVPVDANDPKGPQMDPRAAFIANLPANDQIVLSCRAIEYQQVNVQHVNLHGSLKIQPLNEKQLRIYLRSQPELLDFLHSDSDLLQWLNTPLLLSFLAFAYEGMTPEERQHLRNLAGIPGDLRDRIFELYMRERYQHEARKLEFRGQSMPLLLQELMSWLGNIAIDNIVAFAMYGLETNGNELLPIIANPPHDTSILPPSLASRLHTSIGGALWSDGLGDGQAIATTMQPDHARIADLACALQVMEVEGGQYRFTHLVLRNFFAYTCAISYFDASLPSDRIIDGQFRRIVQVAATLRVLSDPRSRPWLLMHKSDHRGYRWGRYNGEEDTVEEEVSLALRNLKDE